MWDYSRTLMYPVKIKNSNPELAKFIIAQYGGPDIFWVYIDTKKHFIKKCFSFGAANGT